MTQPERIQIILDPDDQPTIVNPVHRGAAIDWKATAQLMGRQILDDKIIREEAFRTIRANDTRIFNMIRTLAVVREHWTFRFKPSWLKTSINASIEG